jgi:peptidyl-prolyl cis-trans isomerase D
VYEQSDSLKPIADKLKLEIKSVTNISRIPVAGVTGVLANSKFLAAIFSADAIEKKRNTEAIETAPNQLTAGRMTQYTPARTLPFNDVRAVVRERLVAIRAAELAKKEGQEKLAAWITKPSLAVMPASLIVSRDQSQNLPAQVLATALRTPASTTPIFVGVDLGNQGYAVVKVNKSIARQPLAAAAELQNIAQYAQRWTEAENQAYYKLLQERFKVEILTPRPTKSSIDLASNANK